MGLAIDLPGDELTVQLNDTGKIEISAIYGDGGALSKDPARNTAAVAIQALFQKLEIQAGAKIILRKKMPLGSGLGSSAASAVAGAFAVNELLGRPFKREELVPFAMEGERVACGTAHADNVAPSMLGGIVLVRSSFPLDLVRLPVPPSLYMVVVHPHVEVLTRDARAVLPKHIPISLGVKQWSNTAGLVAGLFSNDFALIARSVVDHVAEPNRAVLIPHFHEIKEAALQSGALACSISGSGPSIFAMVRGKKNTERVVKKIQKVFRQHQMPFDVFISTINKKGVKVIS